MTLRADGTRGAAGETIRILLIDDQAISMEMTAQFLRAQSGFELVTTADSLECGLKVLADVGIDLVLLDICQFQPLQFVRRARHQGFKAPVLVLTNRISDGRRNALLAHDAIGVLPKTTCTDIVVETVRRLVAGMHVAMEAHTQLRKRHTFTRRQRDVLRAVFHGLSNKEISNRFKISNYCVKTALRQLFNIACVQTRARLVRVALERYSDQL